MYKLVVLSCLMAIAAAEPSAIAPWGVGLAGLGLAGAHGIGPLGWGYPGVAAAAPLGVAWGAPVHGAYNYRGPLSLAPGQPANILAADGRPLDTLSVNLDRAAHYTAQAVNGHGLHVLKKRSAPLLAPLAVSHTSRIDLPARVIAAPYGLAAPYGIAGPGHLGWGAPIAPWGLGYGLGFGHGW